MTLDDIRSDGHAALRLLWSMRRDPSARQAIRSWVSELRGKPSARPKPVSCLRYICPYCGAVDLLPRKGLLVERRLCCRRPMQFHGIASGLPGRTVPNF